VRHQCQGTSQPAAPESEFHEHQSLACFLRLKRAHFDLASSSGVGESAALSSTSVIVGYRNAMVVQYLPHHLGHLAVDGTHATHRVLL